MIMSLQWSTSVSIFFHGWRTSAWPGYLASLMALLLAAVLLEALRWHIVSGTTSPTTRSKGTRARAGIVVGINYALGYLLMLSVMSFNGGVLVAVVVGHAVGNYVLLRPPSTSTQQQQSGPSRMSWFKTQAHRLLNPLGKFKKMTTTQSTDTSTLEMMEIEDAGLDTS